MKDGIGLGQTLVRDGMVAEKRGTVIKVNQGWFFGVVPGLDVVGRSIDQRKSPPARLMAEVAENVCKAFLPNEPNFPLKTCDALTAFRRFHTDASRLVGCGTKIFALPLSATPGFNRVLLREESSL